MTRKLIRVDMARGTTRIEKNNGEDILKIERGFNESAGFTPLHDRLPEFMLTEPIPPTISLPPPDMGIFDPNIAE